VEISHCSRYSRRTTLVRVKGTRVCGLAGTVRKGGGEVGSGWERMLARQATKNWKLTQSDIIVFLSVDKPGSLAGSQE
jgi:hypothetical protein